MYFSCWLQNPCSHCLRLGSGITVNSGHDSGKAFTRKSLDLPSSEGQRTGPRQKKSESKGHSGVCVQVLGSRGHWDFLYKSLMKHKMEDGVLIIFGFLIWMVAVTHVVISRKYTDIYTFLYLIYVLIHVYFCIYIYAYMYLYIFTGIMFYKTKNQCPVCT